ncbi:MAG: polymerase sigma-70 factor, subfamily [Actinomycetota bacterium]|nr:polymerase sigma-70 factor, subfamily [Actinomycetota bacterium]
MAIPAGEMESDSSLVRAVQAGDLEAYSELFRRHYPDVLRACSKRMACPLEAEEIAQGAFVRALERIEQCRGERQFGGWVQIIARHMCVDALRARSRVVPTERPMSEDHADGAEPHDALFDHERTMQVRRALDSLPPRQRQAVTARAQGTGPSEIADDLGLSVGAVDSLILRGRRKLAVAYQRVTGEGGATVTATSARAAAALLAVLSIGSTRLLGGVAAAAEAGRDLVAPVASGVAATVVSLAVGLTGGGPATTSEPIPAPSARPPAVVVSVPAPDPLASIPDPGTVAGIPDAAAGAAAAPAGAVTSGLPTGGAQPATAPAATGTPAVSAPATGAGPLPVGAVDAPIVEPVTGVVDATLPAVTEVVDTVDDTVGDTVDAVTGLLPK